MNYELKYIGIIPARYASTRFPGKPLVTVGGKMMIERVYEQVSKLLSDVYVATDDERIESAVKSFGGKVIMTSANHQSGTDRIAEAVAKISAQGNQFDVAINIQGDEPFISPKQIGLLMSCFTDETTQIATLVKKIEDNETLFNNNSPKVVINTKNEAQYFSRSTIPHIRGKEPKDWLTAHTFYKHIGIYAFKVEVLNAITQLSQSSLELAESLEQLRWIENGYTVKVAITDEEGIAIDTPDDLNKANEWFLKNR